MVSLIDELQRRDAAARAEAEELRGRIAQLAERLAASADKRTPRGKPELPIAEAANELAVRSEVLGQLGISGGRLRELGLTDEQLQALGLAPPTARWEKN